MFRIVSMLLVLTLHITCHGGVLDEASTLPNRSYLLTSFMAYFVYCCVDCFALISGFVGYQEAEKPYRFHKYASFWLQAVFYGLLGRALVLLLYQNQGSLEWWGAFLPVITDNWWYFSAYTALFFLIPFINKLIRSLSSRQYHWLILSLVALFSVVETISAKEPFRLDEGYSFLWLAVLYLIGAWVKRERIHERLYSKRWLLLLIAFAEICVSWAIAEKCGLPRLRTYTSPTILFFAVSLLIFFATVKVSSVGCRKLIRIFAPCAFGVYLMHVEDHFWFGVVKDAFRFVGHAPTLTIPFIIVGFAAAVYLAVSVIELLRIKLFALLGADRGARKLESAIRKHLTERFPA